MFYKYFLESGKYVSKGNHMLYMLYGKHEPLLNSIQFILPIPSLSSFSPTRSNKSAGFEDRYLNRKTMGRERA